MQWYSGDSRLPSVLFRRPASLNRNRSNGWASPAVRSPSQRTRSIDRARLIHCTHSPVGALDSTRSSHIAVSYPSRHGWWNRFRRRHLYCRQRLAEFRSTRTATQCTQEYESYRRRTPEECFRYARGNPTSTSVKSQGESLNFEQQKPSAYPKQNEQQHV